MNKMKLKRKEEETLIKCFEHQFPPELKIEYFDVLIINNEEDREEAEQYCKRLNKIILENKRNLKAALLDGKEFVSSSGSHFGVLEAAFERCTFTFFYVTETFVTWDLDSLYSEACISKAVRNKSWTVKPIYITKKEIIKEMPNTMCMTILNGYSLNGDHDNKVKSLISAHCVTQEDKEKNLHDKRFERAKMLDNINMRMDEEKESEYVHVNL